MHACLVTYLLFIIAFLVPLVSHTAAFKSALCNLGASSQASDLISKSPKVMVFQRRWMENGWAMTPHGFPWTSENIVTEDFAKVHLYGFRMSWKENACLVVP